MNYIKIEKDNMINGPGIRTVLWLSGCSHFCKNCHNKETWDKNIGQEFTELSKSELFDLLSKSYCNGLTLTGGDPLFIENRKDLLNLLKDVKETFPNKTIWCWTGYTIEELIPEFFKNKNTKTIEYEILSHIDILVDGPFKSDLREKDLKHPESQNILKYRGSSNQRIINIKETLNERQVIIYG